jgi:hypothetical protein
MISKTDNSLPYVVLEGIKQGNRFWSGHSPDEDPTKLADGTTAYRILAYCDTGDEANCVIEADGYSSIEHHIAEHQDKFDALGIDPTFLRGIDVLECVERNARVMRESPHTLTQARNVHLE